MVTNTTGMKKGDRRDSGFRWKGNKHGVSQERMSAPKTKSQPPCALHSPQGASAPLRVHLSPKGAGQSLVLT